MTVNFQGYHRIRACGQRGRLVYRVDEIIIIVLIVGVGLRREGDRQDIYEILRQKLEA